MESVPPKSPHRKRRTSGLYLVSDRAAPTAPMPDRSDQDEARAEWLFEQFLSAAVSSHEASGLPAPDAGHVAERFAMMLMRRMKIRPAHRDADRDRELAAYKAHDKVRAAIAALRAIVTDPDGGAA